MADAIKTYVGRHFKVVLQSSAASTNYGWCLVGMPEEVGLWAQGNVASQTGRYGGPVEQHFDFLALGKPAGVLTLNFHLLSLSNPEQVVQKAAIKVEVLDTDADISTEQFVEYNNNVAMTNSASLNGYGCAQAPPVMSVYAYAPYPGFHRNEGDCAPMYGMQDCAPQQNCAIPYGYPPYYQPSFGGDCPPPNAGLKYGVWPPVCPPDTGLKYGVWPPVCPPSGPSVALKYGIMDCQSACPSPDTGLKYGVWPPVCPPDTGLKYGVWPPVCPSDDPCVSLKYGIMDCQSACPPPNAGLKYGVCPPVCPPDTGVKYGVWPPVWSLYGYR